MDLAQRPPYDTIDFKALTKKDPDFKQKWQQMSGKLDFQDPTTTKLLSKAILKSDFNLELDLPDDRLCPPIPNRWNYVSWIHSLIDSTSPSYTSTYDPSRSIAGIDIGTGASAIYTMLCLQSRPNWSMCATDIDKKSFDSAARNLAINKLLSRTKMLQTRQQDDLIPLAALGVKHLDFTICNPPFFASPQEMSSSLAGTTKSARPNAVCTGSETEMVCEGGDLGFVTRLVNESLVLREKVTWYTSLFGKLSSAKAIIEVLKGLGVGNWAVGGIETGGSGGGTKRWIVAWSFGDLRPRNAIARHPTLPTSYLPFPTTYSIPLPSTTSHQSAREILNKFLCALDLISFNWDAASSSSMGVGETGGNVWSRAYRRGFERRKREGVGESGVQSESEEKEEEKKVELAFRIRVVDLAREVEVQWLRGRDRVLWESFCGVVHSKFKI